MIVSRLILKNWRNFRSVDVALGERVFIIGPNAAGKSNLLDVFRFLRDIAKQKGGGLQNAVDIRGGLSKIRCLAARQAPEVMIEIHLSEKAGQDPVWRYRLELRQESRGSRQPFVSEEAVFKGREKLVQRPDAKDEKDKKRLTQTHLEQISANVDFRDIADFFESFTYMHLVPQLVRHAAMFTGPGIEEDPFGRNFLERIIRTPEKTRRSRLKKIEDALRLAVPQFKELKDFRDELGQPHLEAKYTHWRPEGARQQEDQFSDGTLRLIALFWLLLEANTPLLLEEPELSLNSAIIRELPGLMYRIQKSKKRQVLISTHSHEMLTDKGISGEEILLLTPDQEGTIVRTAAAVEEIRHLLEAGLSAADAVLPHAEVSALKQLPLLNFK